MALELEGGGPQVRDLSGGVQGNSGSVIRTRLPLRPERGELSRSSSNGGADAGETFRPAPAEPIGGRSGGIVVASRGSSPALGISPPDEARSSVSK